MNAKTSAFIAIAALLGYLVIVGGRGVVLLRSGDPIGIAIGIGVFVLPVIGLWITWRSIQFGVTTERMARQIESDGQQLDTSELPRLPSGRVVRESADALFAQVRTEVDTSPDDWRAWFRLASAYDLAGDRRRARQVMHKAIELFSSSPGQTN